MPEGCCGFVIGSVACSSPKTEEKAEIKVVVEEVKTGPEISDEVTKQVLMHHLTSFGENNLDALMEDYTEESVVITPDSMFVGLEPIRNFLAGLLPAFPTEGTTLEVDKMIGVAWWSKGRSEHHVLAYFHDDQGVCVIKYRLGILHRKY